MENLLKDFRYGVRTLSKHPTFTLVAVLTLALGIGATTTIFSVVNAVLLRPLPYPEPDRLIAIWGNFEKLNIQRLPAKAGEYEDYARQTSVFDSLGAYTTDNFNFIGIGAAERVRGTRVTASLLGMLGANPEIGRLFNAEDQKPGQDHVVVLSYTVWQKSFGGDVDVINRTISLDGNSYKVIGVISPDFQVPQSSLQQNLPTDVWLPLTYSPEQAALRRGPYYLNVVGRLRSGVSLDEARAHIQRVAQTFERDLRGYRGPNGEDGGWRISITPLKEEIVGDSRRSLPVLLLAVFLLLGASCANVANLILMRAERRRKELAVRAALGASRWRITRQLLVEGILLTTAATGLGLLLANWGIRILASFGDGAFPRSHGLSVDKRVLLFTIIVSILTSVGLGVLPARQISPFSLLRWAGLSRTSRLKRINGVLVVSEVSLAMILLIGSGLLVKSLLQLQRTNPGVASEHLTVAEVDLTGSRYSEATNTTNLFADFTRGIEFLPGIDAVTFATGKPLSGDARNDPFAIEHRALDPNNLTTAGWQLVGPNYLRTLGIPLVAGRDLTLQDAEPGAAGVAIINEAMAARYWPNENPLGRRMTLGLPRPGNPWLTIVGIAKNIPHRTLGSQSEPDCFLSRVVSPQTLRFIFIRSSLDSSVIATSLRNELAKHDREQPIAGIQTMNNIIQETTLSRRFNTWALLLFAITALILAASGIYSVVSYSTSMRAQEIGIRLALGAQSFTIVSLLVRQGMIPVAIGSLVGIGGAIAFSRLLSGLLFGTSTMDPVTYGVIAGALLLVALAACYVPVRRALSVDPLISLRNEEVL